MSELRVSACYFTCRKVASSSESAWPREPGLVSATARTDENGRYVIEGLNNGEHLIIVEGAGGGRSQRISGPTFLDIELDPLSESREPLARITGPSRTIRE